MYTTKSAVNKFNGLQSEYLCFYESQNKELLFTYAALADWFL
jgi:hypothetical protein